MHLVKPAKFGIGTFLAIALTFVTSPLAQADDGPTELALDVVDGYPENNGVHPNAAGYARIAAALHAWLKWQLHLDSARS